MVVAKGENGKGGRIRVRGSRSETGQAKSGQKGETGRRKAIQEDMRTESGALLKDDG